MEERMAAYAVLAGLLDYPEGRFLERSAQCFKLLNGRDDDLLEVLKPFEDLLEKSTVEELQELFTRTFDINPVCTLEVGWHIYGEDYARGEFLVKMREKLREHNIPESRELPDHLSHVLDLLWRLGTEEADQLAAAYVLPALRKMLQGLSDESNPYRSILIAIEKGVRKHHDVEPVEPRRKRGDPPGWSNLLPMVGPEVRQRAAGGRGGDNGAR